MTVEYAARRCVVSTGAKCSCKWVRGTESGSLSARVATTVVAPLAPVTVVNAFALTFSLACFCFSVTATGITITSRSATSAAPAHRTLRRRRCEGVPTDPLDQGATYRRSPLDYSRKSQ